MPSQRGRSLAVAAAVAVWIAGCAAPAPPGRPATPPETPTPIPARVFATLAEGEPELVALEDSRAFDGTALAAAAGSPDAALRARAAVTLGRLGDDAGRRLLTGLFSDAEPSVRACAAFAAGISGDPTLTVELARLLDDAQPGVAAAAARAVGFLATPEGRDALLARIPHAASPEPRASLLRALWRFADAPCAEMALRYTTDPDVKVRGAAVYALARKPQEASLPALTAALGDGDPDTAALAARALGLLGKKESLEPLAAALDSVKGPLVTNSLNALEAILEKNAGAALSDARRARILTLAGSANPSQAIPALVLLRQFVAFDREAFRRLQTIAMTGEGRRREVALQSVVAALKDKAKDPLDRAVQAPEATLRAAAAESLSFLPQDVAAPYRDKLASDREVLVRLAVVSSLKTPEAVRENRAIVDRSLQDPDSGVRGAAVEALAATGDRAVLPVIQDALARSRSDKAPDVAISAIEAAEKMHGEQAARSLAEAAARDDRPLVARLARRALARTFHADASAVPAPTYARKELAEYAAALAEAHKSWGAVVETARGSFTIRLLGSDAPLTVVNFLTLARKHFFDGVPIHRVVPNFVVQDGDPTGTGNGGPGWEIRDEINPVLYGRGTVGMALSGPDTGGSQWFVTHAPQPHLDGIYTVFGQVVAGQEVVDRIEQGDRILRVTVALSP
jgi:cyclophilin family peptidyl-prolyl cis-trans isomerase/HEAT repeat protein